MTVFTGTLVEIYLEDGSTIGKVEVGGTFKRILLTLVLNARVGDRILVESGMGISVLHNDRKESFDVLGYPGEDRRN